MLWFLFLFGCFSFSHLNITLFCDVNWRCYAWCVVCRFTSRGCGTVGVGVRSVLIYTLSRVFFFFFFFSTSNMIILRELEMTGKQLFFLI